MPRKPNHAKGSSAPAGRQIGIQFLADQLNLSIGTISRALRQDPLIKASTRKLVQDAAVAAGYIPNHQARMLRARKTQRLGVMLPSLSNPVYAEKVSSAQSTARELGYDITFACPERDAQLQDSLLRHLISLGVDGLIVMLSASKLDKKHAIYLALGRQIPVVLIGNAARQAPAECSTLLVETPAGRAMALEHLLSLGHRRIGFIGLPGEMATHKTGSFVDKLENSHWSPMARVLRTAGANKITCEHLETLPSSAQSGYDAIIERLKRPGPYPTAYMALDDQVAIGAMTSLQNHGLRVPEDVSIVGSDNTSAAKFSQPCLTTLSQTHLDQGRKAVEMLVRHINDPSLAPERLVLQPTLVIGRSTGPVPADPGNARSQGA